VVSTNGQANAVGGGSSGSADLALLPSANTFVYKAASDSNASGLNIVGDFRHGTDKIDFTNIAGINVTKGVPEDHRISADLEIGHAVRVNTSNAAETVAMYDTHAADMTITLLGVHLGLTGSDFHHV